MAYVKKSIKKPDGPVGRSLIVRDEVILIDVNDIKVMPSANDRGVEIEDDIVLIDGAYPFSIYLTPGTAEVSENSEGDPDQEGFLPSIKGKHPGNTLEYREFKHNCINRNFVVLYRYCSGEVDLIGSPCNPVRLQNAYTGNSSGNANEFTLAQAFRGDGIKVYSGTIPTQEDKTYSYSDGVADLGVSASGSQYLMDKADVVTTLANGHAGDVVTLRGASDSSTASVVKTQSKDVAESNIILKGGDLTLTSGSQVTLRAIDTGERIVWVEQSRYTV
ncbi:MAG: hypothetical protein HDS64_11950 [Bacteroidales bacterium]|nr:hypothetical protein [Bacteroidales bacterium]MBD5362543.1 hypothetical protein [Bacteroides sp.]